MIGHLRTVTRHFTLCELGVEYLKIVIVDIDVVRFCDFVVVRLVVWSTEGKACLAESAWATMDSLLGGPLASITGAVVGLGACNLTDVTR